MVSRCFYKKHLIDLSINKDSLYIYLVNIRIMESNCKKPIEDYWLDYSYKYLVKVNSEPLHTFFDYLLGFIVSNISIYILFDFINSFSTE